MATSQAAVAHGDHAIPADTGQADYPRRWLAAIVLIVGALMDMIDVTIVNVALPSIRVTCTPAPPSWNGWCPGTCWRSRRR